MNINSFLELVHKYYNIEELNSNILHEFIDKIIVHHKEQILGETIQEIEIYYKMIGKVKISDMNKKEKAMYLKYFGTNKKDRIAV